MAELSDEQAKRYIGRTVLDIEMKSELEMLIRFTDGTVLKIEPKWTWDDVYLMLGDSEDD